MRRTARALATGLILALLGGFLSVAPARAEGGDAAWFVQQINDHRRSIGLQPLTVYGPLAASSTDWAQHMAGTQVLAHDGNLANAVGGWSTIGENVGKGPTAESIWAALLASPAHLHNIEDPDYTHVGVGVVFDGDGQMWTTHRFMSFLPTTVAPPPPPPPTRVLVVPTPAPPTTPAPTTTAATAPPPPPPTPQPAPEPEPEPPTNPSRVATMLDALHALHVVDTGG